MRQSNLIAIKFGTAEARRLNWAYNCLSFHSSGSRLLGLFLEYVMGRLRKQTGIVALLWRWCCHGLPDKIFYYNQTWKDWERVLEGVWNAQRLWRSKLQRGASRYDASMPIRVLLSWQLQHGGAHPRWKWRGRSFTARCVHNAYYYNGIILNNDLISNFLSKRSWVYQDAIIWNNGLTM